MAYVPAIGAALLFGLLIDTARVEETPPPPSTPEPESPAVESAEDKEFSPEFLPYVSAKVGFGGPITEWERWFADDWDGWWAWGDMEPTGSVYSFAAGYALKLSAINLRAEFEYSMYNFKDKYNDDGIGRFDVDVGTYMGNFYVDFFANYPLKPYVGFGLGYGKFKGVYKYKGDIFDIHDRTSYESRVVGIYVGAMFKLADGLLGDVGVGIKSDVYKEDETALMHAHFGLRYSF